MGFLIMNTTTVIIIVKVVVNKMHKTRNSPVKQGQYQSTSYT